MGREGVRDERQRLSSVLLISKVILFVIVVVVVVNVVDASRPHPPQ